MATDFFAGSVGGACGILAGYPFDTVKVLMQTERNHGHVKYKSTFQTIYYVSVHENWRRLYRGLTIPLVMVAWNNAVTFGVYGLVMRTSDLSDLARVGAAGATAGLVRTLFISPLEVIKIQMQIPRPKPITLVQCVRQIHAQSGLMAYTKGFGACLTREPLAFAIYFTSFDLFTSFQKESRSWAFVSGGLSGIVSWIFSYPQDVIKTRLQADLKGEYDGLRHCLRSSIQAEGFQVLYRGFGSTAVRAFVVNSVILGVYSLIMDILA